MRTEQETRTYSMLIVAADRVLATGFNEYISPTLFNALVNLKLHIRFARDDIYLNKRRDGAGQYLEEE